MTRFRFRGHAAATSATHQLRQQAYKDAKEASEKASAEAQEKKKKEVKEGQEVNELSQKTMQSYKEKATSPVHKADVESEAEASNSRRKTTWKKAFARKLSRQSGVKTATKKLKEEEEVNEFAFAVAGALKKAHEKKVKQEYEDMQKEKKKEVKEGKEENEARERARRDKNVKKWKQNTDRWAKWKAEQKEKKEVKEETDKDRYKNKSYKHRRDIIRKKEGKKDWGIYGDSKREQEEGKRFEKEVKEEKFSLPEKYEGDHSVRNIYMDEARSGRSAGGAAHDTSYGRGLYGSVADSPVRAAAPRPAAPRPVARPAPQAAAKPAAAPAPTVHGGVAQAPAKPTPTGTSTVAAPSAPKFSAPDVKVPGPSGGTIGGSKQSPTELVGQSLADKGTPAAKPVAPAPSGGIQPGQAKSAGFDPGIKRPELQPVSSYKPAAAAVHGLETTSAGAGSIKATAEPTSSLLGKSPEKTVSPIAKPAVIAPSAPPPKPTLSVIPQRTRLSPSSAPPSDVQSSAPPVAQKPIGPSSSLSATSPELKSILSKDAGPGQSSLTPGLKVTPTPPAAQRQTIRKKVQDIAGPTFENKIPLPDKYGDNYSVRKIYMEGGFVPNPQLRSRPQSKEYQAALSKATKAQIEGKWKRGKSPEAKEYYKALDKERNR